MNRVFLVFPFIILSLLLAVWSGWIRVGFDLPIGHLAARHGALMVNCFLASLVFVERAVTMPNRWFLLIPAVQVSSILAFITGNIFPAHLLIVLGSMGFFGLCIYFTWKYRELYYYVFVAGALCLVTGNIWLMVSGLYADSVVWWMGFLLFTIVAERLELSRFLNLSRHKRNILLGCLALFMLSVFLKETGVQKILLALSMCATATWLVLYDMARRSLHRPGQHRYSAILLLAGYGWLMISGVFIPFGSYFDLGYDALLHSFFIGFVFSMIFSHAPIILPAVTRLPIKLYRRVLYVWFYFLQASLLLRIWADLNSMVYWRKMAGLANGLAILGFFITVALIVRRELVQLRLRKAQ
jgi:hypothetical protein